MTEFTKSQSPVHVPKEYQDGQWRNKIEQAVEARRAARRLRQGKPATFTPVEGTRVTR